MRCLLLSVGREKGGLLAARVPRDEMRRPTSTAMVTSECSPLRWRSKVGESGYRGLSQGGINSNRQHIYITT